MYRFSRAIYRELADEVIEDQHGGLYLNHERVLKACEAAVERLATDRHYFAHPSRTLFNDIRVYFPMTSQLRVLRTIQRYLTLADEFLRRLPQNGFDAYGNPLQCGRAPARGRRVSGCRCRTTATAPRISTSRRPRSFRHRSPPSRPSSKAAAAGGSRR